jgi:hypothetical protein
MWLVGGRALGPLGAALGQLCSASRLAKMSAPSLRETTRIAAHVGTLGEAAAIGYSGGWEEAMTEPNAERLMRAHRYAEAIAVFQSRLADEPRDLGATLRMGLCHLLNRSEPAFLAIHARATALIRELGTVPRQTEELWSHYQHLFKLVTATALVVGGMAELVGCDHPLVSAHKYSGGVYHEPGAPAGGVRDQATEAYAPA